MKKQKKRHILQIDLDQKKKAKSHPVNGVSHAFFPFQPYPEQEYLIQTIHKTVQENKNALIESPTGTGKTLCLLVGALSALSSQKHCSKLFYLTRTHSQISQVISQLKKTIYKCHINIIGSRQQMCINKNLSQLKGRALDRACQEICLQKGCNYRDFEDFQLKQVLDMSQYRQIARKNFFCPYYHSKKWTQKSEISIMPFNYLLDENHFKNSNLSLKNAVIIFDEAHNIDSISQQGSSIQLSDDTLKRCISQLKLLSKAKSKYLHKQFGNQPQQIQNTKNLLQRLCSYLKKQQRIFTNKKQIVQFLQESTAFVDSWSNYQTEGIDIGNYKQFIQKWKLISKDFYQKKVRCEYFENFIQCIERIFIILSSADVFEDYSISLQNVNSNNCLKFQCLNPAYAFKRILAMNPKSIILSSGTLSPLQNWEKDLKVSFQYQISIQSFVTANQVLGSVIPRNKRSSYQFSYYKKNNDQQYEQLTQLLKKIQQIVPNGIVVVFSTYQLMQKTLKQCEDLKKPIFYESKVSNIETIFQEYSKVARNSGAFLFIIMKGRFSQGINFNDQLCRCLLIVGVPFLPLKDHKVNQKKLYLQKRYGRDTSQEWYLNQAIRAVNQAVGRLIRSKNDYGVILLIDQRYEGKQIKNKLSNWFRNVLEQNSQEQIMTKIKNFFVEESWLNHVVTERKALKTLNKQIYPKFGTFQKVDLQFLLDYSTPARSKNQKRQLMILDNSSQPQVQIQVFAPNVEKSTEQKKYEIAKQTDFFCVKKTSYGQQQSDQQVHEMPKLKQQPIYKKKQKLILLKNINNLFKKNQQ